MNISFLSILNTEFKVDFCFVLFWIPAVTVEWFNLTGFLRNIEDLAKKEVNVLISLLKWKIIFS